MGESMGGGEPEDPKGWVPTFNAPTTSLFTGSAAYQYPFLTPPGPGLFQPSLALGYSGAAGNGLSSTSQNDVAGFGWNLAGSIEVAQSVTICSWNGHAACPANAYWYEEDPENGYALPGLIELTLSLGGTGYELTHIDGENQNGYPGRYTLKGNTSLYVEYCRYSDTSTVCMSADNGDNGDGNTSDGAATATQTKGYWVIKDNQNTLYRLGYTTHSEQELINGISSGGQMGPWSGGNAPGHALRWRADLVKDRFGNETDFTYTEYLPSAVNPSWSDNQVHAPASNLTTITYGHNQIVFSYSGRGDSMGIPPYDWYFHSDVISWQTHLLTRIDIKAKDYETGSGTPNLVRAYQFNYLIERHGNANNPNIGINNQTIWCKDQNTSYWGWQLALLTSITELDANGQAKVRLNNVNQPDVEFVYWWYKTAQWSNGVTNRYCAPYLLELHTPYLPDAPVATFTYQEAADEYHAFNLPENTTTWLNTITAQTLTGGWTTDAPAQVTQFSYTNPHYGGKARTDQWGEYTGAFQGFQDVTRTLISSGVAHSLEVNHFLAYDFDADGTTNNSALTGMMDWQELRTPSPDNKVMARSEENWTTQVVTIPGTSQTTRLPIRTHSIQYGTYYGVGSSYNVGNRTDYEYDNYGNPEQVREYGGNVAGTGTPYRVQQTEYVHNLSISNWLIGLPWQVTTWAGEVGTGTIISRQRTRYDNASCTNPGSQIPTNGLPTATDVYIPGGGSGHCDLNYLTTIMNYGQNGDLWWQPSQTAVPTGVGVFPNVTYNVQTIHWRNHSTLEKIVTTSLGETLFGFNDSHTPWLFTDKTAVNEAMSRYEYDTFGRLIKQYTPDAQTGQATVLSQQITYYDDAPATSGVPLYIDTITVPGQGYSATSRTFYDALGRARQQRSWNLASDFDKIVTDTEYNDLGQAICQTTPIITTWSTFNASLTCASYDHTTTSYTRLGSPAISTGLDGLTSYGLALGRTSLGVDPMGRLSLSVQDAYGRLSAVTETEVTEDPFKTGTFNSFNWWLSSSYAYVTTLGGQSVLRVGKANVSADAATVTPTLGTGSSFFFRFQLSSTHHDSLIMTKATDGSGAYVGLELKNGKIYPRYVSSAGSGTVTAIQIDQASGVWYRAHITINNEGQPSWRVWREDALGEPGQQFSYTLTTQSILDVLVTKTWRFTLTPGTTSGNGTAYLYLGAYQQGNYFITRYTYDEANNLETVTDTLNNVTTLTYDLLGRKLTMSDPDMGNWSYAYDLAGNLIRQTDAKNQRLCFTYDNLNRLVTKKDDGLYSGTGPDTCTGGGTTLATYSYHSSGMGLGQVATVGGTNNTVSFSDSFSYDYRGRVTTTSRTIAGTGYSLSTGYDLLDRPTTLTYPGGEVVTTTYDKQVADTLTTSNGPTTFVNNVIYNERLEMTQMNLNNGVVQSYSYLPASGNYRLDIASAMKGANIVFKQNYDYDAVGNITHLVTNMVTTPTSYNTDTQDFSYDSLGRLKTAIATGGVANYDHKTTNLYVYDAIGNLRQMAGNSYDYAEESWNGGCSNNPTQSLPHAVRQVGSNNYYCYDKNGNMTKRVETTALYGTVTYDQAFDVENRLITVGLSNNINTTQFAYDASGQRLRTEVAPTSPSSGHTKTVTTYPFPGYEVEQRYTWQFGCPSEENCFWAWALTATITRKTYFLGGQAIATHISGDPISTNNGFFYLHSDHLGSTSLLTYGNGQTNPGTKVSGSETRYYPYGSQRGTAPTQSITDKNFTGQKDNLELGLLYYNARFYLPGLGRFLTADTIVPDPINPQQMNRYTYVLGNPIAFFDPTGHSCGAPEDGHEGRLCAEMEQEILDSTILLSMVFTAYYCDDWDCYYLEVGGTFHGTILDDSTLLTHDHFEELANEKYGLSLTSNEFWEIFSMTNLSLFDTGGNRIPFSGTIDITRFPDQETSLFAFGKDIFKGKNEATPANLSYTQPSKGSEVAVINWTGELGSTRVDWATTQEDASLTVSGKTHVVVHDAFLRNGSSGGGVYFDGYLIGNNWIHNISDEGIGASLPQLP